MILLLWDKVWYVDSESKVRFPKTERENRKIEEGETLYVTHFVFIYSLYKERFISLSVANEHIG